MPSIDARNNREMKNFHSASEAIDSLLWQQIRKARHAAIASYAAEMSGTEKDLDTELESAGIDYLLKARRRTDGYRIPNNGQ
jgi:phage shock protein A